MCISPNILADGTATACHKCWQCNEQAINDWVGRNIAENKTAVASNAVTLTYGRDDANEVDHLHAAILTYSDVQKFIKLLRFHGYPVRYFVTGEYGSAKGRAHWHIILHWQDKVPPHELQTRFMQEHWPHGLSYWDHHDPAAVRYNCKYILKDMGDDARQGHLAMSKKPPLGGSYFQALAQEYVIQGLAPQSLEYSFPEIRRRKKDGSQEVLPFRLKDTSAENFLRDFCEAWERDRPGEKLPKSELLEHWLTPDDEEERQIRKRFAHMPEDSNRTPAQRIQIKRDADRLEKLAWLKQKALLWLDKSNQPVVREMNPIIRSGPRTISEWNEAFEREQNGTARQKERRAQLASIQRATERTIAEVHARQGRVAVKTVDGPKYPLNEYDDFCEAHGHVQRPNTGSKRTRR